jgi:hypothetical protein
MMRAASCASARRRLSLRPGCFLVIAFIALAQGFAQILPRVKAIRQPP